MCQSPDRRAAQGEGRSKRCEVLESVVGLLNSADDRPALHGEGVCDSCKQTRSHRPADTDPSVTLSRRVSVDAPTCLLAALSKLSAAQMTELVREASNWAFQLDVQESKTERPIIPGGCRP